MLNESQIRFAEKLAQRKTFRLALLGLWEIFYTLVLLSFMLFPFFAGIYGTIVLDDITIFLKFLLPYAGLLVVWIAYSGMKGSIDWVKNTYHEQLYWSKEEAKRQNGLEKASTNAKFKK